MVLNTLLSFVSVAVLTLVPDLSYQQTLVNYKCTGNEVLVVQSRSEDYVKIHCGTPRICGETRVCALSFSSGLCTGKGNYLNGLDENPDKSVRGNCCQYMPPVKSHSNDRCITQDIHDKLLSPQNDNGPRKSTGLPQRTTAVPVKPGPIIPNGIHPLPNPNPGPGVGWTLPPRPTTGPGTGSGLLNPVIPTQPGSVKGIADISLFQLLYKQAPVEIVKGVERIPNGYRVTSCFIECDQSTTTSNTIAITTPNKVTVIPSTIQTEKPATTISHASTGSVGSGTGEVKCQVIAPEMLKIIQDIKQGTQKDAIGIPGFQEPGRYCIGSIDKGCLQRCLLLLHMRFHSATCEAATSNCVCKQVGLDTSNPSCTAVTTSVNGATSRPTGAGKFTTPIISIKPTSTVPITHSLPLSTTHAGPVPTTQSNIATSGSFSSHVGSASTIHAGLLLQHISSTGHPIVTNVGPVNLVTQPVPSSGSPSSHISFASTSHGGLLPQQTSSIGHTTSHTTPMPLGTQTNVATGGSTSSHIGFPSTTHGGLLPQQASSSGHSATTHAGPLPLVTRPNVSTIGSPSSHTGFPSTTRGGLLPQQSSSTGHAISHTTLIPLATQTSVATSGSPSSHIGFPTTTHGGLFPQQTSSTGHATSHTTPMPRVTQTNVATSGSSSSRISFASTSHGGLSPLQTSGTPFTTIHAGSVPLVTPSSSHIGMPSTPQKGSSPQQTGGSGHSATFHAGATQLITQQAHSATSHEHSSINTHSGQAGSASSGGSSASSAAITQQNPSGAGRGPGPKVGHPFKAGSEGSGLGCFSAEMLIKTRHGLKRMDEVQEGEEVLAVSTDDIIAYQPIEWFYHRNAKLEFKFINIETESHSHLSLTPNHLLVFVPCDSPSLTPSEVNYYTVSNSKFSHKAEIGWCLPKVVKGKIIPDKIRKISVETKRGIFSPITSSGTIIVNGIHASCYSTVENHLLQHSVHKLLIKLWRFISPILNIFGHSKETVLFNERVDDVPPVLLYIFEIAKLVLPSTLF